MNNHTKTNVNKLLNCWEKKIVLSLGFVALSVAHHPN